MKKSLKVGIVAMIISLIVTLGLWAFGLFVLGDIIGDQLGGVIFAILFFAVLFLMIVDLIIGSIIDRKYANKSVGTIHQLIRERQERINEDLEKSTRKIHAIATLCKVFIFVLTLLCHALALFIGAMGPEPSILMAFIIPVNLSIYAKIAVSYFSFELPDTYVTDDEFPLIYGLANKAMKELGLKGRLYIFPTNDFDASIAQINGGYIINLGTSLARASYEDELYSIFLHEFAHMSQSTPKSVGYHFINLIEGENEGFGFFNVIWSIFFVGFMKLFYFEHNFYRALASVQIEAMADSIVLSKGDAIAYANALAKASIHNRFDRVFSEFSSGILNEGDTIREDIATLFYNQYADTFVKVKDKWLVELEVELQPRNASHPIYRLRRDALGVSADEVNPSLPDISYALALEADRLLRWADSLTLEHFKNDYEQIHKIHYLDPLNIVNAWEANERACTIEESVEIIHALRMLNRKSDAEELCDRIIAEAPNPNACAHATFYKAYRLLSRGDNSGIDILYGLCDTNQNYAEEALNLIGEYCCAKGLQERLDEYRTRAVEIIQRTVDEQEFSTLSYKDNLIHDDMPQELIDSHISYILGVGENRIKEIHLVKKVTSKGDSTSIFLVDFLPNTDYEAVNRIMNKIFIHLDACEEQYSLFLLDAHYRSVLQKLNTCVYKA
ncbi:MAG: hypothetical protein IJF11_04465 [Clostridia bacterium]|nr:hypothetical protein [Clostridia bacterium]